MAGTDLVVQMGAKLDNFEQGMDKAVSLAESAIGNIQSQFDNLNPTVGAGFVTAGIVGAVGGMTALLGFTSKVNHELAEMDKTARQVGLTTEKFQSLRFAANVGGVGNNDFAEGLQKATGLLADAQRNTNTLSQLFEKNGLKITDNNGKLISTNDLLSKAASLISRAASEQDKIKIAQMMGLSRDWVTALEKGPEAFANMASEADRLGLVIQQSTIDKAKKFDEEWTKASTSLSYQMRAATADAAVWLSELIDQAGKYITALAEARGAEAGSGQEKFNAIADAIDISRKAAAGLTQDLDQVTRALERAQAKSNPDQEVITYLQDLQAKAKAAADEMNRAAAGKAALLGAYSASEFPSGVPTPAARPKAPAGPTTVIPPKPASDEGRDPYEAEVDRITRRVAVMQADTAAVGQNVGAREKLRTEATLYAALERAGIPITEKYTEEIRKQAQSAGETALKLAEANDRIQKLNNASSQFGSALANGFADAILEGKSSTRC